MPPRDTPPLLKSARPPASVEGLRERVEAGEAATRPGYEPDLAQRHPPRRFLTRHPKGAAESKNSPASSGTNPKLKVQRDASCESVLSRLGLKLPDREANSFETEGKLRFERLSSGRIGNKENASV
jgi:hypothetical protein